VAELLFVYSRPARFVTIDRDLLAERWQLREWSQPGRWANPLAVLRAVRRADAVVGWFASWHTFWPITIAWLLRKPSLLIVGGFDTAALPEIGYGYQAGGIARPLSRWIMRRARRLMTNSEYSREELLRNVGLSAEVVHHGVPDLPGTTTAGERERLALTVANVARISLERKGLVAFVEAAAHASDVSFVLVGAWLDDAAHELRGRAGPNVTLAGSVSDEELARLYRTAGAYVQASRHEGFGMAVAEAMLAGCVPVVTRAGALPEVVGDTGVYVESAEPGDVAAGVRRALELGAEARHRARERVVERFPLERRRKGLQRIVAEVLGEPSAG
jgi:glycosyltransferase involved in cell wall biosynthesis